MGQQDGSVGKGTCHQGENRFLKINKCKFFKREEKQNSFVITVFVFQTIVLSLLMRSIGNKNTILLGLGFQILQLAWYGFGSEPW